MRCTFFTQAGLHVVGGHEAVKAEALVHPGGVGALASITDVWALHTFIDICGCKRDLMRTTLTMNIQQSMSDNAPSSTLVPAEPAGKVFDRRWGTPEQPKVSLTRQNVFDRWRAKECDEELLTSAASQIRQQRISAVAAALVAALRVGAERLAAAVLDGALVDV